MQYVVRIPFASDTAVVSVWAHRSRTLDVNSVSDIPLANASSVYALQWTAYSTWYSAWNRFTVNNMEPGQWYVPLIFVHSLLQLLALDTRRLTL